MVFFFPLKNQQAPPLDQSISINITLWKFFSWVEECSCAVIIQLPCFLSFQTKREQLKENKHSGKLILSPLSIRFLFFFCRCSKRKTHVWNTGTLPERSASGHIPCVWMKVPTSPKIKVNYSSLCIRCSLESSYIRNEGGSRETESITIPAGLV